MPKFLSRTLLLSLTVSFFPQISQVAHAETLLWESPLSGVATQPFDLPNSDRLRGLSAMVNKSNPDELIFKVVMAASIDDKAYAMNQRDITVWIYWPFSGCWSKERNNCAGLFTLTAPSFAKGYPTTKSTQYVYAVSHDKSSNVNPQKTGCKVPWWIGTSFYEKDTFNFAVSITCLGVPKDFGFYGYSGIDTNGVSTNSFTHFQTTTFPFHSLAADHVKAAEPEKSKPTVCVGGSWGEGANKETSEEQCTEEGAWEFSYCHYSPLADLQVYRSKTWRKVQNIKGARDEFQCTVPSSPFFFSFSNSSLKEKFRIKNYGNKKYRISFTNLIIKTSG